MTNKLALAKMGVHLIASSGVFKIVNDVISANTTLETTGDAIRIWTGSVVIGSMIADAASKHVNEKIDAVVAWNEKRKSSEATA